MNFSNSFASCWGSMRMPPPTTSSRACASCVTARTMLPVVGDRAHAHDPARYVAVAEFQQALTELNALKMQRAREKAEHAVDEAIRSGKLVPAHREWAIAYCAADPRGFDTFAARQPVVLRAS